MSKFDVVATRADFADRPRTHPDDPYAVWAVFLAEDGQVRWVADFGDRDDAVAYGRWRTSSTTIHAHRKRTP